MSREVSVRELRNRTASVVSAVEAGEVISLTVNRRPVADIVPHVDERSPWIPSASLRRIVAEAGADDGLMTDLADIRAASLDDG
jgi:prevent-host-death family protein